jgi:hypothetical protein
MFKIVEQFVGPVHAHNLTSLVEAANNAGLSQEALESMLTLDFPHLTIAGLGVGQDGKGGIAIYAQGEKLRRVALVDQTGGE